MTISRGTRGTGFVRRTGGVAAIGALVLGGVALALPSAASAAASNIDPGHAHSLTLTKLTSPTIGGYTGNKGEALTEKPTGSKPLAGVTLQVQQVTAVGGKPVDLTTTEGWSNIKDYLEGTVPFVPSAAGNTLGAGSSKTTGADGKVTWGSELPMGMYWVTETSAPSDVAEPVHPFLVTFPAPVDGKPGEWLYDINAYPKNTVVTASKSVDDSGTRAIGDMVKWTVTGEIPVNPSTGVNVDQLKIVDTVPNGQSYTPATASSKITVTPVGGQAQTFAEGADYAISQSGQVVTVTFTGPGRATAQQLIGKAGGTVEWKYQAKTVSLGDAGTMKNQAHVLINAADIPVDATTWFGPAKIVKIAETDKTRPLDDAEFQVFDSLEAAQAANTAVKNGAAATGAIPVEVNGKAQTTFTTGKVGSEEGVVVIPGLKTTPAGTKYWLVETRSPAGYIRQDATFEITVKPEDTPTGEAIETVTNAKQPAMLLAITGGGTQLLLIGAGSALVLGAGVIAMLAVNRRRKAAEQAN